MPPKGSGAPYKNGNRWWGNFESYSDVGGKREPLVPPGAKLATEDFETAQKLYVDRLAQYKRRRSEAVFTGVPHDDISPPAYAKLFLDRLKQRRTTSGRPVHSERSLARRHRAISACLSMPSMRTVRQLRAVNRHTMTALIDELHTIARTSRGKPLAPSTIRSNLMELSAMLTRAQFDGAIERHPLREHPDMPSLVRTRALDRNGFLERSEVRALLENVLPSPRNPWAVEQAYILYYTGCRLDELNGLLVEDIDFENKRVHFREHDHRTLKTAPSRREAPMWPKLERVLLASFEREPRAPGQLAFPSVTARTNQPLASQMMTRLRASLKGAAKRAGITKHLTHHIARHSYITARRSMVDIDVLGIETNVHDEVIIREVGHGTAQQIEETYGHVAQERVRQRLLDYGDEMPDFVERRERWSSLHGEAVRRGLAEREARIRSTSRLTRGSKGRL